MTVPQPPYGSSNGPGQYRPPTPPQGQPYGQGQGQQYGQPVQPYPGQTYPAMYAPPPRGLSIASMVIGIVSLLFAWFTVVIPLVGLILGVVGLRREPAGRGFALTGIWLNAILLGITVIAIVAFLAIFLVAGAAALPFIFIDPSTSTGIDT